MPCQAVECCAGGRQCQLRTSSAKMPKGSSTCTPISCRRNNKQQISTPVKQSVAAHAHHGAEKNLLLQDMDAEVVQAVLLIGILQHRRKRCNMLSAGLPNPIAPHLNAKQQEGHNHADRHRQPTQLLPAGHRQHRRIVCQLSAPTRPATPCLGTCLCLQLLWCCWHIGTNKLCAGMQEPCCSPHHKG